MPNIGEIKRARDIGKLGSDGYRKYIWCACEKCGKERWVCIKKGKPSSRYCLGVCEARYGSDHPGWKGGKKKKYGYVEIRIYEGDFFYSMATASGYVSEHRLVMAKHLGRCLQPFERVHHKNGIRDDNRIENLELIGSQGEHMVNHCRGYHDGFQKGYQDGKDKRIKELEAELTRVKNR